MHAKSKQGDASHARDCNADAGKFLAEQQPPDEGRSCH